MKVIGVNCFENSVYSYIVSYTQPTPLLHEISYGFQITQRKMMTLKEYVGI